MRTSNIILIIMSITVILLSFYYVSIIDTRFDPSIQITGNGTIIEREIKHSDFHTLILDHSYHYYFDPRTDKSTIKSDENILFSTTFKEVNGVIDFRTKVPSDNAYFNQSPKANENIRVKASKPGVVTIGLKNKSELSIICDNVPDNYRTEKTQFIKTIDTIHLEDLHISTSRYHKIDLMLDIAILNIDNRPFSSISLAGRADQMELQSEIRGVVDASKLQVCDIHLSVFQSEDIKINSSCVISGVVKGGGNIINYAKPSKNNLVLLSGNYSEI